MKNYNIAVTGANSRLGKLVLQKLYDTKACSTIVAIDSVPVRMSDMELRLHGIEYITASIFNAHLYQLFLQQDIHAVIHLDASLDPVNQANQVDQAHHNDVDGTKNIIDSCLKGKVRHLVVASSSAAYGFHHDNELLISESEPLSGHAKLPHAQDRLLVEFMLNEARMKYPQLRQTILRLGILLGSNLKSPIANFLRDDQLVALSGHNTKYSFIWERDAAEAFKLAAIYGREGIYNLAGDGYIELEEMAKSMNTPIQYLPRSFLGLGLRLGKMTGLMKFDAEYLDYLYNHPILDITLLRDRFGYTPSNSSAQAFYEWANAEGLIV